MGPQENQNYTDGVQASLYENGVVIANEFAFDSGVCVLPVAEDAPESEGELASWSPVVILRLHAPYRVRRTNYRADKSTNPPVMPTPEKDSGTFVFVGGSLGVRNVLNQSYSTYDWTVNTDFLYVENNVSRNRDGYVLGVPPWKTVSSAANEAGIAAATPTVGAVAHAGREVLVAKNMGDNISPDAASAGTYLYNMPSYLPGTFFSDNLVNGGAPVTPVPQDQQA